MMIYFYSVILKLFFLGYTALSFLLFSSLRLFFKVLRHPQFDQRPSPNSFLSDLKTGSGHHLVAFCSSAGELEQALPVLEKWPFQDSILVLFVSQSGFDFASKRNLRFPFFLVPLSDTPSMWKGFFKKIGPSTTLVVRHEFWPNFLKQAFRFSNTVLIAGSFPKRTPFKTAVLKFFLEKFKLVCTVSEKDTVFVQSLKLPHTVLTTGDPKYDRALSKSQMKAKNPVFSYLPKPILVLGSVYPEDWCLFKEAREKNAFLKNCCLMIVPHSVDPTTLQKIKNDFPSAVFHSSSPTFDAAHTYVLDSVGLLHDLYAYADLAYVGGGQHHRVHNVLEPSAFGIPVAIGPHYHHSREAEDLVTHHLVTLVHSGKDAENFWALSLQDHTYAKNLGAKISAHMSRHQGASERILTSISNEFLILLHRTELRTHHGQTTDHQHQQQ